MPPKSISFEDIDSIRSEVFDRTFDAISSSFPLENNRYRLSVENLRYDKPRRFRLGEQKDRLISGRSLNQAVKGDWVLSDHEGNVHDRKNNSIIAHVPYLTDRGTYIHNGREYTLTNQMRLRPGVYARFRATGEPEAQFNVKPGTGTGFRVYMEPETGVFRMKIQNATPRLYPVLNAMGVTREDMENWWGKEIAEANMTNLDPQEVKRALDGLAGNVEGTDRERLLTAMKKAVVDEDVVESTLGIRSKHLSPEMLLAATQKLVKLQRREAQPDSRDSLQYQSFHSAPDFFSERVSNKGRWAKNMLWRATLNNGVQHIQSGALTPQIASALLHSGLGQPGEEINNLDTYDQRTRVIRLGEGGMHSVDIIPEDARNVQPSYFGFVDPIMTPECFSWGAEVYTKEGFKIWKDVTEDDLLACNIDGRLEFHKPIKLFADHYKGKMYGSKHRILKYLVTPDHRLWCRPIDSVDYKFVEAKNAYGIPYTFMDDSREIQVLEDSYYTEDYDGMVYCAQVPGGLLYVKYKDGIAHWSGNSAKVGVDNRLAYKTRFSRDNNLYTELLDPITGKTKELSARDMNKYVIAFPGEMQKPGNRVAAMVHGREVEYVDKSEVDLVLPSSSRMFNLAANLVPFSSGIKGGRLIMASRFFKQALPLQQGEAPLVRNMDEVGSAKLGRSVAFDEIAGDQLGNIRSKAPGIVERVSVNGITVRNEDGSREIYDLYNNFPFNRKTYIYNKPLVKAGDRITPNQLLAHSNYTDETGTQALGRNLRVAYMPYYGSVTADTLILWYDEHKQPHFGPISEFDTKKIRKSFALDMNNHKSKLTTVKGYSSHYADKVLDIKLQSGREVGATEDHSFVTLDSDGNIVELQGSKLTTDHYLPRASNLNLPVTMEDITIRSKHRHREFNIKLSYDFGFIVGMYVSEGHIATDKSAVILTVPDLELQEETKSRAAACLDDISIGNNDLRVRIYNAALAQWIEANCNCGALNKQVPDIAFGAPVDFRRGFIAGCIAGDGRVCRNKKTGSSVDVCSISKKLVQGLALLMNSIGIDTTISSSKYKPDGTLYFVRVASRSLPLIPEFSHTDKWKRVEEVKESVGPNLDDYIPLFESVKTKYYELSKKKGAKVAQRARRQITSGRARRSDVLRIVSESIFDADLRKLRKLAKDDIQWDRVVKVTSRDYRGFVYDLDMGDMRTFMCADSIFVHNSNFEDAIVISEGAAQKFTSEQMKIISAERDDGVKIGKNDYISVYPSKYTSQDLKNIDTNGVVKPGTVLKPGDPVILSVTEQPPSPFARKGPSLRDTSTLWERDDEGVVTDVQKTRSGYNVLVKVYDRLNEGDKITGRAAGKGIIGKIVPDDQMPHDANGMPFELLINPLTITSRVNPAQAAEAILGKIAEKRGEPYIVPSFMDESMIAFVKREMEKYDVSDTEDIYDPTQGDKKIPKVFTGSRYYMKLHHTSECYDDQTEVLTDRGWVMWPDVCDDDLMATVRDDNLVYEKPIELIRKPFNGQLYCFAGRYIDYAVTGNHRMYVRKPYKKYKFNFQTAESIHGSRFCVTQFGIKRITDSKDTFTLGDRVFNAEDYAELVGWWVTEGCVSSKNKCVLIYQSMSANPDKFERIEKLIERLGLKHSYYKSYGEKYGFHIWDKELAIHFKEFGSHCQKKRLPRYIFSMSLSARRKCQEAMMLGDGCRQITDTGPTEKFSTTSKQLADDFQELCIGIGLGATVRADSPRKETHYLPAWTCGVALSRTDAQVDGDRNKGGFYRLYYDGIVYCATMSTGLLYVRRNGKPMLCGNSKGKARAQAAYTMEGAPAGGGETGSKRLGMMEINALLSHGATEFLRDARVIRGQRNDEFWRAFRLGYTPPSPDVPEIYTKFIESLRAAGINTNKQGESLHIYALTNQDARALAHGEIKTSDTYDRRSGKPIPGGLFDPSATGGADGNRWGYIKLPEPMPNPVMERPLQVVLGLTEPQFSEILSGKKVVDGLRGGKAIKRMLEKLNVDNEINLAEEDIKSTNKSRRDKAVKRMKYLVNMKKHDINPSDFMMDVVPVLPPRFRPIVFQDDLPLVAHPNMLYGDLIDRVKDFSKLKPLVSDEDIADERLNIYKSFKAITGLGDPVPKKLQEQRIRGILKHIFGDSPKAGMFQRRVLSMPVDVVGYAVISPNPDLNMDQVGLPREKAWTIYRPFIMRDLVRGGMSAVQAANEIVNQTDRANKVLEKVVTERPVVINRAPTLHKYGIMAAWPRLTDGHTLEVAPLTVGGFASNFDGDLQRGYVYAIISNRAKQKLIESAKDADHMKTLLEDTQMADKAVVEKYKGSIPTFKDGNLHLFHLQDMPHGEFAGRSHNPNGPIEWYNMPKGVKVMAYNQNNKQIEWHEVTYWTKHAALPVIIINLKSGKQIISDDDPRAIYGVKKKTLEFIRARPADSIGMLVPKIDRLFGPLADVCKTRIIPPVKKSNRSSKYSLKDTIELTADVGYFIGVIAGDGWAVKSKDKIHGIAIAGICDSILDKIDSILPALFKDKYPSRYTIESFKSYGNSIKHSYASVELGNLVLDLVGHKAENKHLPQWFLSTPSEFREGLFAGLIDTDGGVGISNAKKSPQLMVSLSSTSIKLVEGIKLLANSLGIRARITSAKTPNENKCWVVNFSNYDIVKSWGGKYLVHNTKLEKIEQFKTIKETPVLARYDLVPISSELIDACSSTIPVTKGAPQEGKNLYSTIRKAKNTGYISRIAAKKYINTYVTDAVKQHKDWAAWIDIVNNENVSWDEVVSYEETGVLEEGYDLTVPGSQTFTSVDGIVLSNTMKYHVPVTDEAVQEAIDKLMPSKNLLSIHEFKAHYTPKNEFLLGLYLASKKQSDRQPTVFASPDDVVRAYKRGEIDVDDPVILYDRSK